MGASATMATSKRPGSARLASITRSARSCALSAAALRPTARERCPHALDVTATAISSGLVGRYDDGVAGRQPQRDRRARCRCSLGAAGLANGDRSAVGQGYVDERALALIDELLHPAGENIEFGAVRPQHNPELLG